MGISELETAVRLNIPLVVIVYNDAAYGAEVHHFTAAHDLEIVTFPDVDMAAIGRGFGADGITIRNVADCEGVRTWLDGPKNGPLVIDVKVADDGGSWWLEEAFKAH
jgi:thiamine pyrophosphate-dependent acetolactate synthase large subunit-like protein